MGVKKFVDVKAYVYCGVFCALTCIMATISVPIGPVPISLATAAVYMAGIFLGPVFGALSQFFYLLLLFIGLPFGAGFSGGPGVFVGPTAGFLLSYPIVSFLVGLICRSCRFFEGSSFSRFFVAMFGSVVGTIACYGLGAAWFMVYSGACFSKVFGICIFPFIPGDLAKMIIVAFIVPKIEKAVKFK